MTDTDTLAAIRALADRYTCEKHCRDWEDDCLTCEIPKSLHVALRLLDEANAELTELRQFYADAHMKFDWLHERIAELEARLTEGEDDGD